MDSTVRCPVCGTKVPCGIDYTRNVQHFHCPICGRFEWSADDHIYPLNLNQLAAYFVHHRLLSTTKGRYYTTMSKDLCDKYRKEFCGDDNAWGIPVHIDSQIVENWYPKTFSEKIDYILLHIHRCAPHIGQAAHFEQEELYSFLFLDRYEKVGSQYVLRDELTIQQEGMYMLRCLANQGLIQEFVNMECNLHQSIILTPGGYARIDELQKNASTGRDVLVAMEFGDKTRALREAIRSGVEQAGYHAVFIDEVQHNDFITPELLKHIKDSKFVVVDLTHKNNGAYLEEGYAMGLGKAVIQLCKKGIKLHFDVAQKNTIMWESEEDIPNLLCRRINASID